MSIDFLKDCCCGSSNNEEFGLYDEPSPAKTPAYIKEDDKASWIAIIKNKNKLKVSFYAIDHCVSIKREDGKEAKRCDGLLKHKKTITFVELKERKDRRGHQWLKDAEKQLKATLYCFQENTNTDNYNRIQAFVCNKKKPNFEKGHQVRKERFKDETGGVRLYIQQVINID